MNIFKTVLSWFGESNRWKHLCGGILVGLGSNSVYCAAYAGIGVASAIEFKDWTYGTKPDIIDWLLTVIGVAIGYLIRLGIIFIFV